MDAAHAAELLTGLRWLVERLGPDGIEEDESGELPTWFAREAEAALGWEATSQSPPSPGHARLLTAPSADDREDGARNAVQDLMEVLAPLGGPGAFGRLTPAVRAFARDQLSPRALSEGW